MNPFFRRLLDSIVVIALAALGAQLVAQAAEPRSIVSLLHEGGYVIVMRHGATNRDMADTDPLNVGDPGNVAKQRQLSERGRETARDVGAALKALRKFAGTPPAAGTNTLLVTHKPNILDAFGKDWFDVREGEASIFRPDGSGKYELVERVPADRWLDLAKKPGP